MTRTRTANLCGARIEPFQLLPFLLCDQAFLHLSHFRSTENGKTDSLKLQTSWSACISTDFVLFNQIQAASFLAPILPSPTSCNWPLAGPFVPLHPTKSSSCRPRRCRQTDGVVMSHLVQRHYHLSETRSTCLGLRESDSVMRVYATYTFIMALCVERWIKWHCLHCCISYSFKEWYR